MRKLPKLISSILIAAFFSFPNLCLADEANLSNRMGLYFGFPDMNAHDAANGCVIDPTSPNGPNAWGNKISCSAKAISFKNYEDYIRLFGVSPTATSPAVKRYIYSAAINFSPEINPSGSYVASSNANAYFHLSDGFWKDYGNGFVSTGQSKRDFHAKVRLAATVPLAFVQCTNDESGNRVCPSTKDLPKEKIQQYLQDTINAKHDLLYGSIIDRAIKAGHDDMIIRIGHESDGDWYAWSVPDDAKTIQLYKEAFRHVAKIFKYGEPRLNIKTSGNFLIDFQGTYLFNKPMANGQKFFEAVFPGGLENGVDYGDLVDILGIDIYYSYPLIFDKNSQNVGWTQLKGLIQDVQGFAKDHGKYFSVPEWGYLDPLSADKRSYEYPWWHSYFADSTDDFKFIDALMYYLKQLPASGPGSLLYFNYFQALPDSDIHCFPNAVGKFYQYFGTPDPNRVYPTCTNLPI